MPESKEPKRYDVSYLKKEANGEHWVRVGVAFPRTKGAITVRLDAIPMPQFWSGELFLFPKED